MRLPIPPPPQYNLILLLICRRLLCRRRRLLNWRLLCRSGRCCRSRCLLLRCRRSPLQYGTTTSRRTAARCHNRQRHRCQHEHRSSNRCGLGQDRGCTPRPERRLRAHSTKSAREVCRLPALQKYNNNQKDAHNDVQDRKQNDHISRAQQAGCLFFPSIKDRSVPVKQLPPLSVGHCSRKQIYRSTI